MLPSREQLIKAGYPYGKADDMIPLGNPQLEWMRTSPDRVIYIPHGADGFDTGNCQLKVFKNPKADGLIALWTQNSVEGFGDNHLVVSKSSDGIIWSEPRIITGAKSSSDRQASHAIHIVTDSGRIYLFYVKESEHFDNNRQESGRFFCMYSDDACETFSESHEIELPRSKFDNPDASKDKNIVFWQPPIRHKNGTFIAGATLYTSHAICPPRINWVNESAHCCLIRFENVNSDPEPSEVKVTVLPEDDDLIGVPNAVYPDMSTAEEPSVVSLPDGQLFLTMRTMTGYAYCAISSDGGNHFSEPKPLVIGDNQFAQQPLAPCPVYRADGETYLFFFHNNSGRRMGFDEMDPSPWRSNLANYVRNPLYVCVGKYDPDSRQLLRFSTPEKLLDTDDIAVGPKKTAEVGTYTSLCTWQGKCYFWYPDRKYYLLGKDVTAFLH